jgi:hypothetical protein
MSEAFPNRPRPGVVLDFFERCWLAGGKQRQAERRIKELHPTTSQENRERERPRGPGRWENRGPA